MCGIVYAHDFTGAPVNNGILQQFDNQKHRGRQGFGLFDGQEMNMVREKTEDKILNWLCKYDSNLILFHHRFPTSTVNVKRAAHPFSTKDYFDTQYIMVHNGVISNPQELKREHEKLGIKYNTVLKDRSFNDSEALLWDFALTMEGKQTELKATGTIAFICLEEKDGKLTNMYFGRNDGNPLKLFKDKKGIALSSEGNGDAITPNQLYTYNYDNNSIVQKHFNVPRWKYVGGNYSGFKSGLASDNPYSSASSWDNWEDDYTHYASTKGNACNTPKRGMAKVGEVIGNNFLARQFQARLTENVENRKGFVDYDKDGYPIYDDEEADEFVRTYIPDNSDVFDAVMCYLDDCLGNFQEALEMFETELQEFEVDTESLTEQDMKDMMLIEACIKFLCGQPDYIKGEEISNLWVLSMSNQAMFV